MSKETPDERRARIAQEAVDKEFRKSQDKADAKGEAKSMDRQSKFINDANKDRKDNT